MTAATLSAIEMQQNLKAMQMGRGAGRLAIRVVITVGDVLYDVDDLHGAAMSLTARIEKITPADEIYLSHAAWLILPKAEATTSFVNEFPLKGFPEPEKIYKVEQKHRTRIITDQYIVVTDVKGWSSYMKSGTVDEIENFLLTYDALLNEISIQQGGIVRGNERDNFFVTFSELPQTLVALDNLRKRWKEMVRDFGVSLKVGIHKGDLNIMHTYVYGDDVNATNMIVEVSAAHPDNGCSIVASQKIIDDAKGTDWEGRFHRLAPNQFVKDFDQRVATEFGVYQFVVDG